MGFRYRKRIKLGGLGYINLSKQGLSSVSIGKPGATINIGKKGVKGTAGLPGTGLSYSSYSSYSDKNESSCEKAEHDYSNGVETKKESYEAEKKREELEEFLEMNKKIGVETTRDFWLDKKAYPFDDVFDIVKVSTVSPMNEEEIKKHCIASIIMAMNSNESVDDSMSSDGGAITGFFRLQDRFHMVKFPLFFSVKEISSKISKEQIKRKQTQNYYQMGLPYMMSIVLGVGFVFWIGNWFVTLIGLAMVVFCWKGFYSFLMYKHTDIFAKALLTYDEIVKMKPVWEKELVQAKKGKEEFIEKLYQQAISGDMSSISEAIPQILSDVPDREDASVDVAVSDDGNLLVNLNLPEVENLVATHPLTATGKVSSIDKNERQINKEYATCVLNYAFLVLSRFYSAYPKVNNIKLAGFTEINNEVTGNPENTYILYMNSERSHFNNINFDKANIMSLAEHLGYTLDVDDKTGYMNKVEIKDKEMIHHMTDEIK